MGIESINFAVQGLQKSSLGVAKAADNIANQQKPETDLTEDIVDLKINEQNFKANATVLATTKDLQEELYQAIDIEV